MLLNLNPSRKKTPISLTPLIDVVFILLLFFMLTSTFVAWRKIDTPISQQSSETLLNEDQIKVVLDLKTNDGNVFIEDEKISLTNAAYFKQLVEQNVESIFILKADDSVSLQRLLELADQLKIHGAKQVSIANAFQTAK